MAKTPWLYVVLVLVNVAFGTCHNAAFFKGGAGVWHRAADRGPRPATPTQQLPHTALPKSFARTSTAPLSGVLKASPPEINNGDTVTVAWTGVDQPLETDWIAAYTPSGRGDGDFLDWQWVNATGPTYGQGYGQVYFGLINMRGDYIFRYWRDNTKYELAATSNYVVFKGGPSEPLQGRIARTNVVSEMRVMWTTDSNEYWPMVKYGTAPSTYTSTAYGLSKTYSADMMCGAPANTTAARAFIPVGYFHDVLLKDLLPATRYYYVYGNENEGMSVERSFTSAQPVGVPEAKSRLVAFGDLGESTPPGAVTTIQHVHDALDARPLDALLHIGDISYARGAGYAWEQFHTMVEPVATRIPYMVSIGNHEYDHVSGGQHDPSGAPGVGFHPSWGNYGDDSSGECGVPMFYRFHMPDNGNSLFWYSFDTANVHVVMLSTEHDFTSTSPQYNWLKRDLESVDRARFPWVIVTGHRPMYCSEDYPSDYNVTIAMQDAFEDLLFENKVDLFLGGHYHSYERTCPVYKNKCRGTTDEPQAPVHVLVGMAGADLDDASYYDKEWSVFKKQDFGYALLEVDGATSLRFSYILNKDGSTADEFVLKKPTQGADSDALYGKYRGLRYGW